MGKTKKSIKKRFKVTKNKKLLCQKSGQDHFNSREPGKVTRNKKKYKKIPKEFLKTVRQVI
ncbi:MAG: 50S ribosomal protein L35 [Parcubacteria group bacterium ADurb.Bin159]|jgi:ribosomal protein L35|nr:MAG: 50S ribosomal protein L35 [Parcubacteria group bacterium ADurb.Bin159]